MRRRKKKQSITDIVVKHGMVMLSIDRHGRIAEIGPACFIEDGQVLLAVTLITDEAVDEGRVLSLTRKQLARVINTCKRLPTAIRAWQKKMLAKQTRKSTRSGPQFVEDTMYGRKQF
jgi:hypothetical protein